MNKPLVFIVAISPVHGLWVKSDLGLSGIISSFKPKTPLIEGEKIKYSEKISIPNPNS
jgi:hypothetical protein